MSKHDSKRSTATGPRFAFGANWRSYVDTLTDERVDSASAGLVKLLGSPDALTGRSFLDAGCGSGIVSLSALRIGASRIVAFDFDPLAVHAASTLKERFAPGAEWDVLQGSMLDEQFIRYLGKFDVVYCWGVAHHTGAMWKAVEELANCVNADGTLVLALYNDQGWRSTAWRRVKRTYVAVPGGLQIIMAGAYYGLLTAGQVARDMLRGRNPLRRGRGPRRGMSRWHDAVDWIGGYPFEVASPEETIHRLTAQGFSLERSFTVGSRLGCNEFVFRRGSPLA